MNNSYNSIEETDIYFVLDTSGSMCGKRIDAVNEALNDIVYTLTDITKCRGLRIKIAVLEFNDCCRCVSQLQYVEKCDLERLSAYGMTAVGDALIKLGQMMQENLIDSKEAMTKRSIEVLVLPFLPFGLGVKKRTVTEHFTKNSVNKNIIVFMTDGMSTDDYKSPLNILMTKEYFSKAVKIGVAIGTDYDRNMLTNIVGEKATVLKIEDVDALLSKLKPTLLNHIISDSSDFFALNGLGKLTTEVTSESVGNRHVPYDGDDPYIFISYSHKDYKFVWHLVEQMQNEGYRIWYDEGIIPGTEWDAYIEQKLENSACLICCITDNYWASKNCLDELKFAIELDNKELLLVYLTDSPIPNGTGLRMRIGRIQNIHRSNFESDKAFLEKIMTGKGLDITNEKCKKVDKHHLMQTEITNVEEKSNGLEVINAYYNHPSALSLSLIKEMIEPTEVHLPEMLSYYNC